MLQNEEVTDKMGSPPRDALWALYQQEYLPQFNLKLVSVASDSDRQKMEEALTAGIEFDAAAEQAGLLGTSDYLAQTGLKRPKNMPESLLDVVRDMQVGQVGGPVDVNQHTYFFEVLERNDGTDEDFEKLGAPLRKMWRKQENNRLTGELIERLKIKFEVEVDQAVLEKISLEPLEPEVAELVAIRFGDMQVQAKAVQEVLIKDHEMRFGFHGAGTPDIAALRESVVYGIISQTLVGLESLDRRYEEEGPLRKEYRFYCQNRMIKELEQEISAQFDPLSDAEIEAAYHDNIDNYTQAGLVEVATVQTREEALAERVAVKLQQGGEFEQTVAPIAPLGVKTRKVPFDHLEEPVRNALSDLAPGQVSSMIPVGNEFLFVKLIKRGEQVIQPLEMVRRQLVADLTKRRFQQARQNMVDQLRERSTIKVKQRAWKQLLKQLNEGTE